MEFFDQIQEKRQEQIDRVNSICYAWKQEISKGIIDSISRDAERFPVKKKGSEIIAKLEHEYTESDTEKKMCLQKMIECVKEIGFGPNCEISSWRIDGYEDVIGFIPYRYGYDQIYGSNSNVYDDVSEKTAPDTPPKEQQQKMRKYNDHLHKYIDKCIEMIKLKVAIGSINKNGTYAFSVEQASKLGF